VNMLAIFHSSLRYKEGRTSESAPKSNEVGNHVPPAAPRLPRGQLLAANFRAQNCSQYDRGGCVPCRQTGRTAGAEAQGFWRRSCWRIRQRNSFRESVDGSARGRLIVAVTATSARSSPEDRFRKTYPILCIFLSRDARSASSIDANGFWARYWSELRLMSSSRGEAIT
jgi:hypothetical protein